MHYMARISHRMQKHIFGIMCPIALFVESVPVSPEQDIWCIDISCPLLTRMHYVTCRSHRMQRYNFGITCPGVLFVESVQVEPEHEK
jgi:hypothetical protein